jgi:hypothetical protein
MAPNGQIHPVWNVPRADTLEGRGAGSESFFISILVKDEDAKVLIGIL